MRLFLAGSTGVIGRRLLPLLVARGHDVTALVRDRSRGRIVQAAGARPVVADALVAPDLTEAVVAARPEVVLHQLTALSGFSGDFRNLDAEFALTNRLRTEVTDTLLEAGRRAGARRFVAQSFCGWPFARQGGPVKTEDDPLDDDPPAGFEETLAAIRHLEDAVCAAGDLEAIALRYGFLYGPGTGFAGDGATADLVRRRRFPVVGGGAGVWSFVHVDDVASATARAVDRGRPGLYNVVDDEPAPVAKWLPFLAQVLGAPKPLRIPGWLARFIIGQGGVVLMTRVRGGSNAKARRELDWTPSWPTWRVGFPHAFGPPERRDAHSGRPS